MFKICKSRIVAVVAFALVVTASTSIYHIQSQKKEQATAVKLREIQQRLVAKNAVSARLSQAEKMLVSGEFDTALPIIREIAEAGDARAQHDLGWAYYQGIGLEKNYVQALSWFTKAAEAGDKSASYYVGEIYYNGFGTVEADKEKAIIWFKRASESGVKEAAQYLDKIEKLE